MTVLRVPKCKIIFNFNLLIIIYVFFYIYEIFLKQYKNNDPIIILRNFRAQSFIIFVFILHCTTHYFSMYAVQNFPIEHHQFYRITLRPVIGHLVQFEFPRARYNKARAYAIWFLCMDQSKNCSRNNYTMKCFTLFQIGILINGCETDVPPPARTACSTCSSCVDFAVVEMARSRFKSGVEFAAKHPGGL